jgi:hypothetical protein
MPSFELNSGSAVFTVEVESRSELCFLEFFCSFQRDLQRDSRKKADLGWIVDCTEETAVSEQPSTQAELGESINFFSESNYQ